MMDDGEVDSPESGGLQGLPSGDYSHFLDDSSLLQSDWDNLLRTTQVCSHKHICNPTTGPDNTHTHTCEHTHTHTISSGEEEKHAKKKRPSGNKEAVRKYREKQKAVKVNLEVRNAELEKENRMIPELLKENLRLRNKLQEQAPTQAALEECHEENKRLKSLLLQVRRLIDSELDSVNYQRQPVNAARDDACESGPAYEYYSSGVPCIAPPPCYPARPSPQAVVYEVHRRESVGWHPECEHMNTRCHDPVSDSSASQKCTTEHAEGSTKVPCSASQSGFNTKATESSFKVAKRRSSSVQSIPIAYRSSGVPCPGPGPSFTSGQSSQLEVHQQGRANSLSWQGGCELLDDMCPATEMTVDSSGNCTSLSPEEATQSVSTVSMKETTPTSSGQPT